MVKVNNFRNHFISDAGNNFVQRIQDIEARCIPLYIIHTLIKMTYKCSGIDKEDSFPILKTLSQSSLCLFQSEIVEP